MGCLVVAGLLFWRYSWSRRPLVLTSPVLRDTAGQKDNSTCLVCHLDLETEEIAAVHLKAGIVCAACHGASEVHRSDEQNIMKPEVTFGRLEIEPFCKACHPTHKSGKQYRVFVSEWTGRRRPNGRMVTSGSICMDCHGNHAVLPPEQQTGG
jgi:hypothetical protein